MRETKKTRLLRRVLAVTLTVVMLLSLTVPASAAGTGAAKGAVTARIEKIDNSEVSATAPHNGGRLSAKKDGPSLAPEKEELNANGLIRVSIVLEEPSTIEAGYSTMGIGQNAQARSYREKLRANQTAMQKTIESKVLNGNKLDVVWNLTLAANIISANVPVIAIDKIAELPGVAKVVEEQQYAPAVVSKGGELEPNMAISGEMTGSKAVWADGTGYTGAGTRVAIIDTGLDTDHQSFDAGAFDHAIDSLEDFDKSQLMTVDEIKTKLKDLNIKSEVSDASKLYLTSKVPFAFNYVDGDLDVTHDNDGEGEHGSHVAGIAAANRFVDTNKDGEYEEALEAVKTAGNAPDAQLLVMKVFGKGGGAYDSDYMVAIEDAIVMDADAINLSLGSAMAGHATSDIYQDIMDSLADSDTVVTISAGNSSYWAENTPYGYLYSDGVNFSTDGSPGSYTNAFTVASVDNAGMISPTVGVNGEDYGYTESSYTNPPIGSLDTTGEGVDIPFIMVNFETAGHDDELVKALADEIKGKVYITWRGTTSFSDKGNAGYAAGAAAVIIGNNQAGTINMDLSDYVGNVPVISLLQADANKIWNSVADKTTIPGVEITDAKGQPVTPQYITGTVTVKKAATVFEGDSEHKTMSSFSSWGIPGDLSLKPEITAPGGNIYSVNGLPEGGTAYELMSGTSMAAPQVAGISALVQQYIKEEKVSVDGLNSRALTQALLMSTATPIVDDAGEVEVESSGYYYPVFQQGAGLINVAAAVSTPVVITVDGQADGKVKAELGDDPEKNGEYEVTFTLHNMDAEAHEYELDADVFTQDVFPNRAGDTFLDTWVYPLEEAEVSFDQSSVTVPAGSSVTVTATITLDKEEMTNYYDDAGSYVEAYIFATPVSDDEGAMLPELSFPVLGYYGSWTDPSMYDVGSLADQVYGGDDRVPYLYYDQDAIQTGPQSYLLTYNYLLDGEGEYFLMGKGTGDRWNDYLSADTGVSDYYYAMIRNAGNGMSQVTDAKTGDVYYRTPDFGSEYGAFYYSTSDSFQYYYGYESIDWFGTDKNGKVLEDGTEVDISVVRAPEYYADENGEYDWDVLTDGVLGNGAYLTTSFIMDSTAPEIVGGEPEVEETEDGYTISFNAQDKFYVAEVDLYADDGETFVDLYEDTGDYDENEIVPISFDELEEGVYKIALFDYAENLNVYRLFVGVEATAEVESVTISEDAIEVLAHNTYQLYAEANPMTLADRSVTWKSSNTKVATVDANGVVTGVAKGTATITAAAKMDPSKTATCQVTVFTIEKVLTGVLADDSGNPRFFDYDLSSGKLTMGGSVAQYPVAVSDASGGSFYLLNTSSNMYKMDKATGKVISGPVSWANPANNAITPWSTSNYSEAVDGVFYTYGPYLAGPDDPNEAASWSVWNLSSLLNGAYLMGVAVLDKPWEYDFGDGEVYSGDCTVYVIDTANTVWEFAMFWDEEEGSYTFLYGSAESDLTASIAGYDGLPYSNVVVDYDGALYYSMMTGMTNDLYRLVYDEDTDTYKSSYLGNVGRDVWPALLLNVLDVEQPVTPPAPPSSGNISISDDSSENGSVSVDTSYAEPGDTVTVTPEPSEGFITGEITVTDADGNPVKVVDNKDGTYTFVMPDSEEVTIDAGFITPGTRFKDLDDKAWYRNAVAYAVNHGLMSGTGATTFEPNTATTRGMIVSILYRLEGSPAVTAGTTFSDVPASQWYAKAVAWGNNNKIVSGYGNGKFGPNDPVTREQMASILYRYARYKGYDLSSQADLSGYVDAGKIGNWALEAMKWANDANLITGRTDTTLVPGGKATRVESASILMRYCRNVAGMD
ncbi:MAG: S8 family serine peptidase [Acutalibacter sp.]|nr:S8 family serine peptidase [Acutalibacter sp.]